MLDVLCVRRVACVGCNGCDVWCGVCVFRSDVNRAVAARSPATGKVCSVCVVCVLRVVSLVCVLCVMCAVCVVCACPCVCLR